VQSAPAAVGPRRTHGAAIAATVVSLPAANIPGMGGSSSIPGASPNQSGQITPPPVSVTPPPQQAIAPGATPTPKPAAGGNFRETLWFKKGDVDQMVADARARVEAARAKGIAVSEADAEAAAGAPAPVEAQVKPLEEQYVDDGSVTAEDRKKFSLRSGGTSTALPAVGQIPGERMSDAEVMGEIGGKKRIGIIIVAVIVAALLGIFFFKKMTAGKDAAKNAAAMAPSAIPTTTPPPPEATPPPAPPTAPVAAVKPPPAATKHTDGDEPAPPKASHSSAKKHAAKKAKGKKAHK
jgi:hypothetical protein